MSIPLQIADYEDAKQHMKDGEDLNDYRDEEFEERHSEPSPEPHSYGSDC